MEHGGSVLSFFGLLFVVAGPAAFFATVMENWKIRWPVWDRSEQFCCVSGVVGLFVGIFFLALGCGGTPPGPVDPVHVEVVVCEPTLGTDGQYYELISWRREIGVCAAMRADFWEREEILGSAEDDVLRLGEEYDAYNKAGRTDCYCGPVCREMVDFVEQARADGLVCGP